MTHDIETRATQLERRPTLAQDRDELTEAELAHVAGGDGAPPVDLERGGKATPILF